MLLEDFHRTRGIGSVTWKVELQTLRTFFGYCVSHRWITANPAKELKPPRNIKPNEVVPYTLNEESLILAACDKSAEQIPACRCDIRASAGAGNGDDAPIHRVACFRCLHPPEGCDLMGSREWHVARPSADPKEW